MFLWCLSTWVSVCCRDGYHQKGLKIVFIPSLSSLYFSSTSRIVLLSIDIGYVYLMTPRGVTYKRTGKTALNIASVNQVKNGHSCMTSRKLWIAIFTLIPVQSIAKLAGQRCATLSHPRHKTDSTHAYISRSPDNRRWTCIAEYFIAGWGVLIELARLDPI